MEIEPNEWLGKAISNITNYLHRGGHCEGDKPQLIGGSDLLNTIGFAMGLPMYEPKNWTQLEFEKALKGQLVYFVGKAREAIDVIADQIRSCCGGDDKNFVTVLPVELYHEGKLYELPVFRVKRYKDSQSYYVDNIGRRYGSAGDWIEFNKLPPGEMAFPHKLILKLKPGSETACVNCVQTPCSRLDTKMARTLDTVATFAGIGSSVALVFLSGGLLALPLVATSVACAGYGTARAGYQLVEKAAHGENVDPIRNPECRMLWLGIAASLTSFTAMGASMRITSLAARGKNISDALKLLSNITSGTNVAVSAIGIINTSIYMFKNHKEITKMDILLHVVAIGFWTKGVYNYKTANAIIKETQNYAFAHISKELNEEQAAELLAIRNRFQNDAVLLQRYHAAMAMNISTKDFSQFLIDGLKYYDSLANLSSEQIEAFCNLQNYFNDDFYLIEGLNRISNYNRWNAAETMENVINMWQRWRNINVPEGTAAILREGNILLGRAPPIKIEQLCKLSPPMMQFFGQHLSQMDIVASRQWAATFPMLIDLQNHGMFTICPVNKVVNGGRAVILLNNQLEISIHKLYTLPHEDCKQVFMLVGQLPPSVTSAQLPQELVKLCVREHRLRFQCQRIESVNITKLFVANQPLLQDLVQSELRGYEQDRLYTFVNEVKLCKSKLYMQDMMKFVSEMQPKNISEMVAYCQFVMTCVQDEMLVLSRQIKNKELVQPINTKKSVWIREMASKNVFKDINALKQKFENLLSVVIENDMVGVTNLASDLSDTLLVDAIKKETIKFGSAVSAAYHVLKHPVSPPGAYVARANDTLRAAEHVRVSLGQDGDVRILQFEDTRGKCFLLERSGGVLLCSFMRKH